MKRLCVNGFKKNLVALGLAAAMVVGVSVPAYAEDAYDLGYEEDLGENLSVTPAVASEWYGTYSAEYNGVSYGIEIAPCWDDPGIWNVLAMAIVYNNGIDERLAWSGQFVPEYTATAQTAAFDENDPFGMLDDGSFNSIYHVTEDGQDVDACLVIAKGGTTGTSYLGGVTFDCIDYGMIPAGAPATAFLPDDASMLYTKISDTYELTFSGWNDSIIPSWYWDVTSGPDPVVLNWDIQSNTPAGQKPASDLSPAIYDWYYSDCAG